MADTDTECPACGGPLASDGVCADDTCGADEDDGQVCADGYPEHDTRDTYRGPDGVQWECRRCGAEGWEPADGDQGSPS